MPGHRPGVPGTPGCTAGCPKLSQRTAWGGGKKRGVENLTTDTPPKKGFWTPLVGTFSTPLRCQCSEFPVQKSTTEQTKSSFGGVKKFPGGRVLWYVFLPPYVLHPPHIMAQLSVIFSCALDIFETPFPAPRPTEPQNPPATQKEIPKTPKTPVIPKSKHYFPKSKRSCPKSNVLSPNVNVKYIKGIFEECKVVEISCWEVRVTGVSKISNLYAFSAPKLGGRALGLLPNNLVIGVCPLVLQKLALSVPFLHG